jgi:hypothetical protein
MDKWGVGVLEYWKNQNKKISSFIPALQHSNTPLLQWITSLSTESQVCLNGEQ